MLIKLALLLLVVVALIGVIGKFRPAPGRFRIENAAKCPDCGVYLIGDGKHQCGGKA